MGSFSKLPPNVLSQSLSHLQSTLQREGWDLNQPILRGARKIKQKACAAGEGQCCRVLFSFFFKTEETKVAAKSKEVPKFTSTQ